MASSNGEGATREEWCLGWKLAGTRPLTPEEVDALKSEARGLRLGCWMAGCGFPLLVFFLMLFLTMALGRLPRSEQGSGLAMLLMLVILCPAILLVARASDWDKWAKGSRRDLRTGQVKRFEGMSGTFDGPREWLATASSGAQNIEVLAASGRLWSINGRRLDKWTQAEIASVAPSSEYAERSAYWHQAAVQAGSGNPFSLRDLSEAEKGELLHYSRTIWRKPLVGAVLFDALIAVPLVVHFTTDMPIKMEPGAYLLVVVAVLWNWNLWRTLRAARALKSDSLNGRVALVNPSPSVRNSKAPPHEAQARLWEILPHAGVIWTADGVPASWRNLKS